MVQTKSQTGSGSTGGGSNNKPNTNKGGFTNSNTNAWGAFNNNKQEQHSNKKSNSSNKQQHSASTSPPKKQQSSTTSTTTTPTPNSTNNVNNIPNQHQPTTSTVVNNTNGTTFPTTQNDEQQNQLLQIHRERFSFLFLHFVGQLVELITSSGDVYEGIFHTVNSIDIKTADSVNVVLKLVKLKKHGKTNVDQKTLQKNYQTVFETLVFKSKDIFQIYAKNITFASERKVKNRFMTDTEISNRMLEERELVKWQPEDQDLDDSLLSLEESVPHNVRNWDQFAENYRKFGVTSTYEEHVYTTYLDRDSEFYKLHEEKAQKIAEEIERQTPGDNTNIHILEERGLLNQMDYSEEDLYSSVIRENEVMKPGNKNNKKSSSKKATIVTNTTTSINNNSPAKYIPPHQRDKMKPSSITIPSKTSITTATVSKEITTTTSKDDSSVGMSSKPTPISLANIATKARSSSQVVLPHPSIISKSLAEEKSPKGAVPSRLLLETKTRNARSNSFSGMEHIGPIEPIRLQIIEEHKRLRKQLYPERLRSGSIGSQSSTPNSPTIAPKSPKISSPIVSDINRLDAIILEPPRPKIPEHVLSDYMDFKSKISKTPLNRERETASLKAFSVSLTKISDKFTTTNTSSTITSTSLLNTMKEKNKSATPTVLETKKEEKKVTETKAVTSSGNTTVASSSTTTITTKTKSTLNPNAKEFRFNPNATAFVPKGVSSGSSSSTTTTTTATTSSVTTNMMPQVPPPMTFYPPVFTPPTGYPGYVPPNMIYQPYNPSGINTFTRSQSWANLSTVDDRPLTDYFFKEVALDQLPDPKTVGPSWLYNYDDLDQRRSYKENDPISHPEYDPQPTAMPYPGPYGYGYPPMIPPQFPPANIPPYNYQPPPYAYQPMQPLPKRDTNERY
ncbi:hypothetical protein ABK040_014214 [Willaertia magna]